MRSKIFLVLLFLFALLYRFSLANHPFWTDEFSSAIQSRLINQYGIINFFKQTDYYAEPNNIITHLLITISFLINGESEFAARLPSMIIGSFIPVFLYLLSKELFNNKSGVVVALLSSTSYFMITWSRQARGYALQQLLLLLILYFYIRYKKTRKLVNLLLFFICSFIGTLTHYFLYPVILILLVEILLRNIQIVKKYWIYILITVVLFFSILLFLHIPQNFINSLSKIYENLKSNNLWYYHVLFWRNETLVSFLGLLGILYGLIRKNNFIKSFSLIFFIQLAFIIFLIPAYTSRYALLPFTLLLLFASYFLSILSENICKELKIEGLAFPISILLTLFIIFNGNTFTFKPKTYYSVDHSMRDIALVDYHEAYTIITTAKKKYPNLAVIETWLDRARWYLGQEYSSIFWYRWLSEEGSINGLPLSTTVIKDSNGKLIVPLTGPHPVRLIATEADLVEIVQTHPQGFIWIDDTSMPEDIQNYAKKHFTVTYKTDHYQFDDNPYSIWPATLYSWGLETVKAD